MTNRADYEELVGTLNDWTSATEVAAGRIEVSIRDGTSTRTVTIVMTEDDFGDMAGPMWGSVTDAIEEVIRILLTMTPDQDYLLYGQYEVVPSTEPTWPERPKFMPEPGSGGGWFAYKPDGSRGGRFADHVDPDNSA
jgi:hypothetical protein